MEGFPITSVRVHHCFHTVYLLCLQISSPLTIDVDKLPHIKPTGRLENMAALFFWGSVLKSLDSESNFIQLTSTHRDSLSANDLGTGSNVLSNATIRKCFIYLQNCIVMVSINHFLIFSMTPVSRNIFAS